MRTIIALTTFCLFSVKLFSQDTIVVMDGGQYIGKVLEVSETEITFQRMDTERQYTLTRKKKYIAYIKYQNGTISVMNEKGKDFAIKRPKPEPIKVEKPKPKRPTPMDVPEYKKRRLSFSVNIFPLLINERSLNVDYLYNYRHSTGIRIGQIFANKQVQGVGLFNSVNQDGNLFGVWNGMVVATNYKCYFNPQRRQYIGAEITYRSLHYSNQDLIVSQLHRNNMSYNYFQRSEHTNEFGFNIQYGIHLIKTNSFCNIEAFGAIGVRYRYRNYTTYTSTHNNFFYGEMQPVGEYKTTQVYPMITIGLKIGYNKK